MDSKRDFKQLPVRANCLATIGSTLIYRARGNEAEEQEGTSLMCIVESPPEVNGKRDVKQRFVGMKLPNESGESGPCQPLNRGSDEFVDLDITRFYKGLISLDVRDIFPSLSPASAKAINRNALRVACMSVSSLITRQRIECFRAAPADTKQGARYRCTQTIVGEDEDARCSCEAYHRVDLMYGKEKHTVTRSEKAVGVVSHAVPSRDDLDTTVSATKSIAPENTKEAVPSPPCIITCPANTIVTVSSAQALPDRVDEIPKYEPSNLGNDKGPTSSRLISGQRTTGSRSKLDFCQIPEIYTEGIAQQLASRIASFAAQHVARAMAEQLLDCCQNGHVMYEV